MQKQKLKIDKMIIALIDHNRRQQFSKDTKALAAKKEKSKIIIGKKKSITLPSTKKAKGKKYCKHYGSARHIK